MADEGSAQSNTMLLQEEPLENNENRYEELGSYCVMVVKDGQEAQIYISLQYLTSYVGMEELLITHLN